MARRTHKLRAALLLMLVCGAAAADEDDEQPDAEFLEYLGTWEDEDDNWLLVSIDNEVESEEVNDPDPRDTDATENEDES